MLTANKNALNTPSPMRQLTGEGKESAASPPPSSDTTPPALGKRSREGSRDIERREGEEPAPDETPAHRKAHRVEPSTKAVQATSAGASAAEASAEWEDVDPNSSQIPPRSAFRSSKLRTPSSSNLLANKLRATEGRPHHERFWSLKPRDGAAVPRTVSPIASHRQVRVLESALAQRVRSHLPSLGLPASEQRRGSARPLSLPDDAADDNTTASEAEETPRAMRQASLRLHGSAGGCKTPRVEGSRVPLSESLDEEDLLISLATPAVVRNPHHRTNTGNLLTTPGPVRHLLDATPAGMSPGSIPQFTGRDVEQRLAGLRAENSTLASALKGQRVETDALRATVQQLHERVAQMEEAAASVQARHSQAINNVAQDLHRQYSEKHAVKVRALKKSYEEKYAGKLQALEAKLEAANTSDAGRSEEEKRTLESEVAKLQRLLEESQAESRDWQEQCELARQEREEVLQMAQAVLAAREQEDETEVAFTSDAGAENEAF